MLRLLTPKADNAWIEHDRSERSKLIAATLSLLALILSGLGVLVFALSS